MKFSERDTKSLFDQEGYLQYETMASKESDIKCDAQDCTVRLYLKVSNITVLIFLIMALQGVELFQVLIS